MTPRNIIRYNTARYDITYRFVNTSEVDNGSGDGFKAFFLQWLSRNDGGFDNSFLRLHHLIEVIDHLVHIVNATIRTVDEE